MGVLSMKGGDGEHSYANNSLAQVSTFLYIIHLNHD